MKLWAFAKRNTLELLRDPMNYGFGIGFPVVVMLLLTAIQANIPVSLFEIERLAPGMAVFGLSFVSLFSGMLLARDRASACSSRLRCCCPRRCFLSRSACLREAFLRINRSAACAARF